MTNWPTKKLGEVVEFQYGKGIDRSQRDERGDVPIYGANGILGWANKAWTSGEAIIVGRKGSAGEVTRISGKFWPSDVTYYVLGNDKVDIDYLFHFLKSADLPRLATGVKPGINRNRVYEIEIPVPSIEEQKKIVAKIEKSFAKADEAARLRAESAQLAAELLPAALHEIFSSAESKGWEEKELDEIAPIKRKNNDELLPYIGMENIESGTGNFIGSKESKKALSNTFYFDESCLLYGRLRPYLNKIFLPDFKGHCSTELFPLIPNQKIVLRKFLFYWMSQQTFIDQAMGTTIGSRMPRANMKKVIKFKIPLPPLTEQKKIVKKLDALAEKARTLRDLQSQQASDLKALKQSILHDVFSGSDV